MKYKIELHCHTSEVSGCSNIPGERLAHLYAEAGYSAIHVTDHFTPWFIRDNGVDGFLKGYEAAYEEGKKIGLKVYLGAEYRFNDSSNDYLLFGVTPDFLRGAAEYFDRKPAVFHEYCKENGVLFYQAHPFRSGLYRAPIGSVDGIEIWNMHPDHNSRNNVASEYAAFLGYNGLSGSDAHRAYMVGRGGITADTVPEDSRGLHDLIVSGKYELYRNDKELFPRDR